MPFLTSLLELCLIAQFINIFYWTNIFFKNYTTVYIMVFNNMNIYFQNNSSKTTTEGGYHENGLLPLKAGITWRCFGFLPVRIILISNGVLNYPFKRFQPNIFANRKTISRAPTCNYFSNLNLFIFIFKKN